jgi:hypothetical protein
LFRLNKEEDIVLVRTSIDTEQKLLAMFVGQEQEVNWGKWEQERERFWKRSYYRDDLVYMVFAPVKK